MNLGLGLGLSQVRSTGVSIPEPVLFALKNNSVDRNESGAYTPTFDTTEVGSGAWVSPANSLGFAADGDYAVIGNGSYLETTAHEFGISASNNSPSVISRSQAGRRSLTTSAYGRSTSHMFSGSFVSTDTIATTGYGTSSTVWYNGANLALASFGTLAGAVYNTGLTSAVTAATLSPLEFNTNRGGDGADQANNRINISGSGWYVLSANWRNEATSAAGACWTRLLDQDDNVIVDFLTRNGDGLSSSEGTALVYLSGVTSIKAQAYFEGATVQLSYAGMSAWQVNPDSLVGVLGWSSDTAIPNAVSAMQTLTPDVVVKGSGALVTDTPGSFIIQEAGWYMGFVRARINRAVSGLSYYSLGLANVTTGTHAAAAGVENNSDWDARSALAPIYGNEGDEIRPQCYTISGQNQGTLVASTAQVGLLKMGAT